VDQEVQQILDWQKKRDPTAFTELVFKYQPIVNSVVNKYRTVGVSPSTLRAQASTQLIKALNTFKPDMGAKPSTHIWNQMQKVQRVATESLSSGHMPEYRSQKRSMFVTVRDNLEDRLGYEPNIDEMADELSWDRKEVARMNSELGGEVTASQADFDFFGNAVRGKSRDMILADYLYHDLKGKEKTVFEHVFGFGGKPILNNKEIAKKLNTNEMAVVRMRRSMAGKIKEYR
jgi:DNA-directed RNA polymerase specialized sigma subunit